MGDMISADQEWQQIKKNTLGCTGATGGAVSLIELATHGVTGFVVAGTITAGVLIGMAKETQEFHQWRGFALLNEGSQVLTKRARGFFPRRSMAAKAVLPKDENLSGAPVVAHAVPAQAQAETSPEPVAQPLTLPGPCTFSQALASGWRPSLDQILLGFGPGGEPIMVEAAWLCHVALCGPTEAGKSSIIRMLEAQILYAGACVLHLDPHFTPYDVEQKEDWTPFLPRYEYSPVEASSYELIEFFLKQMAEERIPHRLELRRKMQPTGRKYFVFVDELPAIIAHIPGVEEYLAAILREGRKVGIYLVSASQDFLVKTVSPGGGGAVRDCFRTVFYSGGDATSARVLLDCKQSEIPEAELGRGLAMLRCRIIKQASMVRVPYMDNEALVTLLGPSTYVPTSERHQTDVLARPHTQGAQDIQDERPVVRHIQHGNPRRRLPVRHAYHREQAVEAKSEPVKTDLERGMQVYVGGNTSLGKFSAAMGFKTLSQARNLWEQVKFQAEQGQPK